MNVLDRIIGGKTAVASAGGDNRNLAFEIDEAFEDRRHFAELLPGARRIRLALDQRLALAVIAEPPRLHHRRQIDLNDGNRDIDLRTDLCEGRRANAKID